MHMSLYEWLTILVPGIIGATSVVVAVVALIRSETEKPKDGTD